jgi:hypothetical protein
MIPKFFLGTAVILAAFTNAHGQDPLKITYVNKISNIDLQEVSLDAADHLGAKLVRIGDFDQDGVQDLAVGAGDDEDGGYKKGCFYIVLLNESGSVKKYQKISETQGNLGVTFPTNEYKFGFSVTAVGDINGDQVTDFAVGAVGANGYTGAVWVLLMKSDLTVKSAQKLTGISVRGSELLGSDITTVGDLDGDGINEIAAGAYSRNGRGAVYLIYLKSDGSLKSYKEIGPGLNGFNATLQSGDLFGMSVDGPGDINGDGYGDLLVGANGTDGAASNQGAVYILYLSKTGTVSSYKKLDKSQPNLNFISANTNFGVSVCGLPDMNGDGYRDLLVGSHTDNNSKGSVYVVFLDASKDVKATQKISSANSELANYLDNDDIFGNSVTSVQLTEGKPTLVVGAPYDDDVDMDEGAFYLINVESTRPAAIQEVKEGNSLLIFPNPSSTKITVKLKDNNSTARSLMISDMSGKIILSREIQAVQSDGIIEMDIRQLVADFTWLS